MKNNLDKVFKESLEGHEYAYDPKAWDALSKALDKKVPSGNQGSTMKWYLGGAAIIGAVIISAVYLNNSTKTAAKSGAQKELNIEANSNKETNELAQENKVTKTVTNNASPKQETTNLKPESANPSTPKSTDHLIFRNGSGGHGDGSGTSWGTGQGIPNRTPNPTIPQDNGDIAPAVTVVIPEFGSACQGQTYSIDNRNDVALTMTSPSGNETLLRSKTKTAVTLDENGVYNIAYIKNNQVVKQNSFHVNPAPSVDLSYDPINIYDKGLPSIQMKSSSIGTSFEWTIPGTKNPVYGKEVNAHFFNKGTYKVNLTVTSSNGCSATETMNVNMPEDYNLMAVNAINPNSHIEKNRTFMPHALKERNTPFTLLIIDPATGAIIFESNDVNNPWTGIDRRNGQVVEVNRPYVWKVSLQKPMDGEKAEYKGTVILQ